jgi:hypothetical protein
MKILRKTTERGVIGKTPSGRDKYGDVERIEEIEMRQLLSTFRHLDGDDEYRNGALELIEDRLKYIEKLVEALLDDNPQTTRKIANAINSSHQGYKAKYTVED